MAESGEISRLRPLFSLIGSIREGTRLDHANEIDVAVHFEALEPLQLRGGTDATRLVASDPSGAMEDFLESDGRTLDYPRFFRHFAASVEASLGRTELPPGLSCQKEWRPCHECHRANDGTGASHCATGPPTHCAGCLPPVTLTKVGLCLLFSWEDPDGSGGQRAVLSADLVPLLPLAWCHSLEGLHETVFWSLFEKRPTGWREYCHRVAEKDRMLLLRVQPPFGGAPGEGSPEAPPGSALHHTAVVVKFLNFGDGDGSAAASYVVRPGQGVDSDWLFENKLNLRETYAHLKALKSHLGLSDLSSFFLKKMVYHANVHSYGTDVTKVDYTLNYRLMFTVIGTALKGIFKDAVDLPEWRKQIFSGNRDIIPLHYK